MDGRSSVTYGAEICHREEHDLNQVEDFASKLVVLDYHEKAATHYGDIRADLERKRKIIGASDLHIAAHARSERMISVSNNTKEFERIEGLRLENWILN
jgi:tRNA(fMet)-specific endonuclease VapC